jgi:hypothetical protein
MKRSIALGVAGTAVAVAAVGGVAFAADSSTSSTPTTTVASAQPPTGTTPAKGAKAHRRRAAASRALHGQFTVERKGKPTVVDVQRGTVSKADPSSVTVQSTDGFEATYALSPQTKIRDNKAAAPATDLTVGKKVGVLADDDGGHPAARVIRVLPTK